jgi:diguanylate cyclase (GGDEF)-like protein
MADIGRLTRLQHDLQRERRLLHDTLTAMADAVITTDHLGHVNFINAAAEDLIERKFDQVSGRPLNDIIELKKLGEPIALTIARTAPTGWFLPDDVVLVMGNAEERPVVGNIAPILNVQGEIAGTVIVLRDANAVADGGEKRKTDRILDPTTGLVNRTEFEQRLRSLLERSDGDGVLLYLDLDEFKIINDTCGHIAGDELLRRVAALLQRYMIETDTLARLGGDEFGVLLRHKSLENAKRVADEICCAIQAINFEWDGKHFRTGASIGVVTLRPVRDDATRVMRDADRACYAAKEGGRNQVHVFGDHGRELALQAGQMDALSNLHDAIAAERLHLFAQPIVPIAGSDGLPHVEILLRMHDTDGKLALPGTFLPAAERYHQMPLVDRWVVARTFELLNELDIANRYVFAINLSGQSVGRQDFLDFVIDSLQLSGIDPAHICFEITEGAAIANVDKAHEFLSVLRELGCRFALDDFGVGMSSLSYLRRLPIDYLKIDGSFIREIGSDPINEAMVRAIHQVALVANVKTVAESIESFSDLNMIEAIGVDLVQGYLVAPPMPLEDLRAFKYVDVRQRFDATLVRHFVN